MTKDIEVTDTKKLTPTNEAIYDAGKLMLVESLSSSREYCKFMITLSSGSIPIYLTLLKFFLDKNLKYLVLNYIFFLIPLLFWIISIIIFTVGYIPKLTKISLDVIENIEFQRTKLIRKRIRLNWSGFSLFLIGVLIASYNIINLGFIQKLT